MILVDTSIWIDHLRSTQSALVGFLEQGLVASHPFVIEELALGNLGSARQRADVLDGLSRLAQCPVTGHDEVLSFVNAKQLWARGLDLVDAHLLASTLLTPGGTLWTRDNALDREASQLGVSHTD